VVANSDGTFSVSAIVLYLRLNTFTNLKILLMSPFHKVYYKLPERLPPSLEILQLQYAMDHEETDEYLDYRIAVLTSLAANKDDYVPQLKHVIWWYQQKARYMTIDNEGNDVGPMYGAEVALTALARVFKHVGVTFEWLSAPSLRDTAFGKPLNIYADWVQGLDSESRMAPPMASN